MDIYPSIARDPFLHTHVAYYVRELRIAAYAQFLESYKRCVAPLGEGACVHRLTCMFAALRWREWRGRLE